MKRMTRRQFLKTTMVSTLALTTAGALSACSKGSMWQAKMFLLRLRSALRSLQGASSPSDPEQGNIASKTALILGTGGTRGIYYSAGCVLASVLNEKLTLSSLQATATGASKANIMLIEDGEADLAFVQNNVMYCAADGTGLFEREGRFEGFRTVCGVYPEACQCVCSANIKSFQDLKGKKVAVGAYGSSTEMNAQQILAAYGLTYDDIEVWYDDAGSIVDFLKEGKLDAAFLTSSFPNMIVMELFSSNDIHILAVDDEHANLLISQYPFYTKSIIPAGTYDGLEEDVVTVAVKATLIASVNLSEDVVYELLQAIFDNLPALTEGEAKFGELSLESAIDGLAVPLHPGAESFFRDAGVAF